MFDFKTRAELRHINVRAEFHGEETVPCNDLRLMLIDVPIDKISSLVPALGRMYEDKGDALAVYGAVLHTENSLSNLNVTIIGKDLLEQQEVVLERVQIKKGAKIHLLPGRVANVDLKVQAPKSVEFAAAVQQLLRHEIEVAFTEMPLEAIESEAA